MEIAILIVGAATFYVAAMVLMKFWSQMPPVLMVVLIASAFMIGAWCEIEALKIERLSAVYVAILAVEFVIVSGVSYMVIGEQFTVREVMGGALVISGLALAAG